MPNLVTMARLDCRKSPSMLGPNVNLERWEDGELDTANWPVRTKSPLASITSIPEMCW